MNYDPIKDRFGELAAKAPAAQRALYAGLQAVFLRNWYVRRAIRELHASWPEDKPLRVLDAGTGFGQHSYFIAKTFPQAEILAVDVKQDYLDQARRFFDQTPYKDRIRFEWADLTQFERDEQFDFILSVDVMEHIEEDVAVFQNFAKVLAPGGHVVINTPSDQ
ncbi:MAG: class I SAM-dependent methyltransferase, partial [Bacteroidota bacterium]